MKGKTWKSENREGWKKSRLPFSADEIMVNIIASQIISGKESEFFPKNIYDRIFYKM